MWCLAKHCCTSLAKCTSGVVLMNCPFSRMPFLGHFIVIVLTYLTPWCRVLLEKLTGLQLVKKFPAFYGTRRFITAFTSLRHPSLSCARPIQSTCPQPTSWRSILILPTHLRLGLPSGLFPSGFPTRTLYALLYIKEKIIFYLYQNISGSGPTSNPFPLFLKGNNKGQPVPVAARSKA